MKKKVGIITMHKVLNYGSALQAWATQQVLKRMGYDAVLIDYIYPNKQHKKASKWKRVIKRIKNLLTGDYWEKKRKQFEPFWVNNYELSAAYQSEQSLRANPPECDIYMVGSDQVWNQNFTQGDSSFLLGFVPVGKPKVAYASSFSNNRLTNEQARFVLNYIERFDAISVREKNAADVVEQLLHQRAEICLDPTLLLTEQDYAPLIAQSQMRMDAPYLLVYVLNYAFDPYPYVSRLIENIAKERNLRVVCIDYSRRQKLHVKSVKHMHDAISPCDFLWLFAHADFIVTTSFHGTAFALNFHKQFCSVVNDLETGDDRMINLLHQCGADSRIVRKNTLPYPKLDGSDDLPSAWQRLAALRGESINWLSSTLDKASY